MTAITWGQPINFDYAKAKRDNIIAGKTPVLRTVKNSATSAKLTTVEGRWDSTQTFANVVHVQFPAGDPAYLALRDWIN